MSNKKSAPKKVVAAAGRKTAPAASRKHPKPGLGRGLGALISRPSGNAVQTPNVAARMDAPERTGYDTAAPDPRRSVLDVPVAEISRSPWQPRQTFDAESLSELADSIRANGVIQPLICRKTGDARYELVAGEHRLRAAIEAKLATVPVILVEAEDRRAAELAIIENIQRQDLNAIEEAEGYHTLAETFNLTQQEVADRVGKARASVANALRLLDLPDEVKQLISSGLLSTGHAKVLLSLTDVTEQTLLGRKAVTEGLTVRALEKVVQRRNKRDAGATLRRPGQPDLPESYVRDLTDRLHKHFGTAIRLSSSVTHANGKHTKGILEIDFYDNDDLDRLLTLFGITLD